MDALMKIHAAYFTDKENYPAHDNGCVNELLLDKYLNGRPIRDQLSTKSNGCGIIGRYGYGMATTLLQGPNFYDVLMIMEMPN